MSTLGKRLQSQRKQSPLSLIPLSNTNTNKCSGPVAQSCRTFHAFRRSPKIPSLNTLSSATVPMQRHRTSNLTARFLRRRALGRRPLPRRCTRGGAPRPVPLAGFRLDRLVRHGVHGVHRVQLPCDRVGPREAEPTLQYALDGHLERWRARPDDEDKFFDPNPTERQTPRQLRSGEVMGMGMPYQMNASIMSRLAVGEKGSHDFRITNFNTPPLAATMPRPSKIDTSTFSTTERLRRHIIKMGRIAQSTSPAMPIAAAGLPVSPRPISIISGKRWDTTHRQKGKQQSKLDPEGSNTHPAQAPNLRESDDIAAAEQCHTSQAPGSGTRCWSKAQASTVWTW